MAAMICDFIDFAGKNPDPILVGGQYSTGQLVKVAAKWLTSRNFVLTDPDTDGWIGMFVGNYLDGVDNGTAQSPDAS
jgi:hypothetical protein